MRFSYLIVGLFTDHPLLIDISPALVVILVSDLPPLSAPLLMCGIAKKALHLFLNLQGSFFTLFHLPRLDCYFHENHKRSLERGFLLLVTKRHYTAKQYFSF